MNLVLLLIIIVLALGFSHLVLIARFAALKADVKALIAKLEGSVVPVSRSSHR